MILLVLVLNRQWGNLKIVIWSKILKDGFIFCAEILIKHHVFSSFLSMSTYIGFEKRGDYFRNNSHRSIFRSISNMACSEE